MRNRLRPFLAIVRRYGAQLGEWFAREWAYLLPSAVIATLVFFSVQEQLNHKKTLTVPIEIRYESLLSRGAPPAGESIRLGRDRVQVTFHGDRSDIERLGDGRNLKLEIPYSELVKRRKKQPVAYGDALPFRLKYGRIQGVRGPRVSSFDPPFVDVYFDKSSELTFRLETPPTIGNPVPDRNVRIEFEPKEVTLRGSQSLLDPLHKDGLILTTAPIDLEGRAQDFTCVAPVQLPTDLLGVTVEPAEVNVSVYLSKTFETRSISNVAVRLTQEAGGVAAVWQTVPTNVVLTLKGPKAALDAVCTNEFCGIVNVADGGGPLGEAHVWIPFHSTSVEIVSVDPPRVKLIRVEQPEPLDAPAASDPAGDAAPETEPATPDGGAQDAPRPLPEPMPPPGETAPGEAASPVIP